MRMRTIQRNARRRPRRPALAAVLATGALAATASAASAAPATTASPSTGLDPAVETTVTVRGTGFVAPDVTGGVYVAQSATVDGTVIVDARRAHYVPGAELASGTFERAVTVTRTVSDGTTTADCTTTPCAITTWRERTFPTAATIYASTPLTFATAAPSVAIAPTADLDPSGTTTVTVRGAGFLAGTYVAVTAIVDGRLLADQSNARWVRPGGPTPAETLAADGTFTTTVTVSPTFTSGETTVDCRVTQCAISTWRQHSVPTPASLFTTTPIAFAQERPAVVRAVADVQRLGRDRTATIAVLTCGSASCRLSAPRTVRVRIGTQRHRVRVLAPRTVRAGARARVRVKLTPAAARALRARRATVRVTLTVISGAQRTKRTVVATVAGAKRRGATTR